MLSAAICKQKPMILLYCEVNWFTPALVLSIPCENHQLAGLKFWGNPQDYLKEHVALDRTSWSIKAYVTVCYKMHMIGKMF